MPADARQLGRNIRLGLLALILLVVSILTALLMPHKASAAGLLPDIASVDLPLGDTILEPVLGPVTNTTNAILPVDINPGSDSVGATVDPPLVGQSDKPVVSVSMPVQPVVKAVTRPIERVLIPRPIPTPPSIESIQSVPSATTKASTSNPVTGNKRNETMNSPQDELPFFASIGSNTYGMLPQHLRSFASSFAGRPDFTASLISIAIFIAVIAMIANVLYVSERGGMILSGNSRLAKISQRFDLTQLSVLAIATFGTVSVAAVTLLVQ